MKQSVLVCAVILSIVLVACGKNEAPPGAFICDHQLARGQFCVQTPKLVCGSNGQTYQNGCYACKDEKVDYYTDGSCPGGQPEAPMITQCSDKSRTVDVCTTEYKPVCADVDNGIRCIKAPCPSTSKQTFSNACEACKNPKTYAYIAGACPIGSEGGCPAGFDQYAVFGNRQGCVQHYTQDDIKTWSSCSLPKDCKDGQTCAYATRDTSGNELTWSGTPDVYGNNKEALRCIPSDYEQYMISGSNGLKVMDQYGHVTTMIT